MKWSEYNLDDLIHIKHGYAFKGEFFSEEPTDDILLTPGNFAIGGGFKAQKLKYYNGEFPVDYVLDENDVIVTMTDLSKDADTLGFSAKVPSWVGKRFLHNQRIGLVKLKTEEFDINYLYWLMRTFNYQRFVANGATGATVKHTSPTKICQYKFIAPSDKTTQGKIASILSAYDDLIENNLKRIKLLEEKAILFYKQFKKETYHDWVTGKFADFFKINNGCAFKAEWYSDNGIPILRTRDYSYSKFINIEQPIFIDDFQAENFTKFLLKEFDFMLIMVGASIGRYGIVLPKELPILQNQNQWALRENIEFKYLKVTKLFILEEVLETLLQQRTGAARDFFRASFLNELKISVPPEKIAFDLNNKLENNFMQINLLLRLNTKLREARDILLPRLMSGQIEV